MLEEDSKSTVLHQFLVNVEIDADRGPSPEKVALKMADSLMWVERVGEVNVDYLGTIETEVNE